MTEYVIHPDHYNKPGRKECVDEMTHQFGPKVTFIFELTNAYKYLYRMGDKDIAPKEQDIAKAKNYFNMATELRLKYPELNTCHKSLYNYIKRQVNKI